MEATLWIFAAAVLAFLGAFASLVGVRGTCSGSCDRLGAPACESCPRAAASRRADRKSRDG